MKKPNILFFLTDDQRFDTVHSLGCDEVKTPNLDAFTKESVIFNQAHIMGGTTGGVCMPSRAMLQTGRTLFNLNGRGRWNGYRLSPEHTTIGECFKNSGYYTHHIGKWHQDRESFGRSYLGGENIFGFHKSANGSHFSTILFDYDETNNYDEVNAFNIKKDGSRGEVDFTNGGMHSTDIFADSAINFINEYDKDQPFYLYLATVAPHDPRQTLDEYEELYNTENVSCPENFMPIHPFDNGNLLVRDERLEAFPRRKHAIRRHIGDYYAMITHIDKRFGDIIETLKNKGLYDDMIIIYSADNGLAIGQHGLMGKQNLYEHSSRVPLMIKLPKGSTVKKTEAYCYLLDIFPTLCDMCEVNIPESVEGKSLMPVITGQVEEVRDFLFGAYRNFQRCYKQKDYKLIEYYVNGKRTTQLFDVNNDPLELNNLADDKKYYTLVEEMRKKLLCQQELHNDPLIYESEEALSDEDIW